MDQFGNYNNSDETNQNNQAENQGYQAPQNPYPMAREPQVYGANIYGATPSENKPQQCEPQQHFDSEGRPIPPHGAPPHGMPPHGKKGKRPPRPGKIYLLAIVFALIASIIGTVIANEYLEDKYITSDTVVLYQSAVTTTTSSSDATYASVTEAVFNTVVEIYTEAVSSSRFGQYVTEGAGSGVIISEDGYIITNNHVIDGATTVYVATADGTTYKATVIGSDSDSDIAVLKIDASGLQAAVFADSDTLVVGEEVLAVGNPLGELGGSVTNGIISALDREIDVDGVMMNLLQTNAAINPGNSGGGLFNMDGELVGIVNAKSTGDDIDNIGFAIPANDALAVATDLIEIGYVTGKPALGISVYEFSSSTEARQYGFTMSGVYIVGSTNSEELLYGDLILSVDDVEITETDDIATAISGKEIGDTVTVVVLRERTTVEIEVTLVEYVG
ncbi:MAG: trypsin-like peptidase domain-containing protein [Bacillota bacterium]